MEYGIGLDIGIASIGWAAVGLNEKGEPCGLLRCGSRIFTKAEQPKTGESLALPRREARSMRRRLRRKALRKEDVYALLAENGLATKEQLTALFEKGHLEDIYALRTRALDEAVSKTEFCRILLHLCQRRGFKSNRRNPAAQDKESGQLLRAVEENTALMAEKGYRTVGEMFCKDEKFAAHKRNKAEEYLATVGRDMVSAEAEAVFAAQRSFGAAWATPELEAEYLSILLRQRSFDDGPGGNSPYGGNMIERMVGTCTLEPSQPRAAKACYSFEYFTLLQKLAHLRLEGEGESRALNRAEMDAAASLTLRSADVSFARLRKELSIPESLRFNAVRYRGEGIEDAEKKEKLRCMRAYHTLRKALDAVKKDRINSLSIAQRDAIGDILSKYKNEDKLREHLKAAGIEPFDTEALLTLPGFSGFGHISVVACRKLTPFLEQGMTYNAACDAAGYSFKGHSGQKSFTLPANMPEMEDITSPVVRRAVSQTIKVLNAVIREQGYSPAFVNIELARELSRNFTERREMDRSMQENAAQNERLMDELRENFHLLSPTGLDLTKYRLWKEQDGRCAYSLQPIEAERLFEKGYAEIDHIMPYSISFDDTRANKVLVLSAENRQKGNRLPLQYLQGAKRDAFIVWVNSQYKNSFRKRRNLLKEKFTDADEGFRQRSLQDTQHMAVFLYNYINDYLLFSEFPKERKRRVVAVSGAVTAHMRRRWGLTKVRADGDTHHALDAIVIACTTQGMVQQVSGYYGRIEGEYLPQEDGTMRHSHTGEVFPTPWVNFRNEIAQRLSACPQENLLQLNPDFYRERGTQDIKPVFVSRMPQHKVTGAAHMETIRSARHADEGILTAKQPLTALRLTADGEIQDYYMPQSDTLLYKALVAQLEKYHGDAAKAFAAPFHKPKADGTPGPVVNKVKLIKKSTLNVPLAGGTAAADNGSMVRIDVFYVPDDGYYWVPIYVADTLKKELPNKAVTRGKPYKEWKEMCEDNFVFSLYPNDLIHVTAPNKATFKMSLVNKDSTLEKEIVLPKAFVYYCGANISTGAFSVCNHDNSYQISGIGTKTLESIKKYQVDVLGNIHEVTRETRRRFR